MAKYIFILGAIQTSTYAYLDGSLVCLLFDSERLPNAQLFHVDELARVTIDTPWRVTLLGVFGAQSGQRADHIGATILDERARYDLEGAGERAERPLSDARDRFGFFFKQSFKNKNKMPSINHFQQQKNSEKYVFILTDVFRIGIWPKIDPIWGANDFTVFGVIFLFDGYGWFGFKKNSKLWRHMTFTSFLFIFLVKVKNFLIYNKNKFT